MAVVLPVLRLWLLLLNLYGTFKAMKPPPLSQRSARNGQGPSARAMQLRKRELKSRLAVWVVWAMFSTIERPLDRTIGLLIPFYNELKCIVLLFLLVSRAHGAEAIFLHVIHPVLRPYVPAVDDILVTLHSVFDLLTLLFFLPWEYVSHWWQSWTWTWIWGRKEEPVEDVDEPPHNSHPGDGGENIFDGRRVLRPRTESQQARMKDAERQARVIFQDIDDAQDRVRTRTRSQLVAQGNARNQPIRASRAADPNAIGLRTRRRVLEHPSGLAEDVIQAPGSKSTGVHHIDPTAIAQLAQGPALQPFPVFPHAPTTQPVSRPSPLMPIPTPPSSSQSSHEIWYPPQLSSEGRMRQSTPPGTSTRRTPSPIYPPLPAAYRFTPRRSDPLPAPPRVVTPPNLVTPTPRRVSTGVMSRGAFDAFDGIDQFADRSSHAGPSRTERSAGPSRLPYRGSHAHGQMEAEDFFHQALEPSIQTADMDMDTETLSTRDGSSANEESMEEDGTRANLDDMAETLASDTKGGYGVSHESASDVKRGKRKATTSTGPTRRSTRKRNDRSSSVETDEFGFTVRPGSSTLSTTVDSTPSSSRPASSLAAGPSKKKPLARTKPALKTTQEEGTGAESSDEEGVKKRRKLRRDAAILVEDMERREGAPSQRGDNDGLKGKGKGKGNVRSEPVDTVLRNRQVGTRATRASTRQPPSEQAQPRVAGVTSRDRGR